MTKKLWMATLLVVLGVTLIAAPGSSTRAQDGSPLCGSLPTADCEILTGAVAEMSQVQSATFTLDYRVDLFSDAQNFTRVHVAGDGSIDGLNGFLAADLPEPLSLLAGWISRLAGGSQSSASADVPAAQANLTVVAVPPGSTTGQTMNFPLRLIAADGVLYLSMTADGDTWLAADSEDLAGLTSTVTFEAEGWRAALGRILNQDNWNNAQFSRQADESLNGQNMAVFEATVPLSEVVSTAEVQALIDSMIGGPSTTTSPATSEAGQNSQLVTHVWIGEDDSHVHRVHTILTLVGLPSDEGGAPQTFTYELMVDWSAFDAPVTIQAPSNAMQVQ